MVKRFLLSVLATSIFLLAAGVSVELYNCPGAYHGAPPLDERTAGLAFQVYNAALGAALNPDAPTSGF